MQLIDLCFKKAKCSSVQRQYILICVSWKNIDPRLVNNNVFLDYSVFINHLYLRSIDKLFWTTEFTLKVTFTVVFHKCKELSSCHSYFLVTGYFSVKMTQKKNQTTTVRRVAMKLQYLFTKKVHYDLLCRLVWNSKQ